SSDVCSSDLCAEQPMTAAPAASPSNCNMNAIATLEIGAVSAQPIKTATMIPMTNGCLVVAQLMISPSHNINELIGVPMNFPVMNPANIVVNGVTIISTRVEP